MISLSNSTSQTLAAGASLTFDTVNLKTGCAECHRTNTASVKLCAKPAIYEVHFSANVTNATNTDAVQLAMQLSGDTLSDTTMISTPAAASSVNNVSTSTLVRNNCCDYDRITITNTGMVAITVSPNATLFVKRVA